MAGKDEMVLRGYNGEAESSHRRVPGPFEIVAMASSAGGLNALSHVLSELPAGFVPVVVVQHLDPHHASHMAEILSRRTALRVCQAKDGDQLVRGTVHIAPPDRHLLVNSDRSLSLTQTDLVHFVRPSADLLFQSVAASYREQAIAIVLTGSGSDGRLGVEAVKKMGGVVIAQDRASSEFFGMPGAAIELGVVDMVLALDRIGPTLVSLAAGGEEA